MGVCRAPLRHPEQHLSEAGGHAVEMTETRFGKREEGFHQILLHREYRLTASRVALPSATAEQLPVYSARIVQFGRNNVQTAGFRDTGGQFDVSATSRHVGRHGNTARNSAFLADSPLLPLFPAI